jgi:acyl carrier protein
MTDASAGVRSEADVRSLIRQIIGELAPTPGVEVESAHVLVDDLGYHSLALLELAFTLEDEFGLPPIDEETARGIRLVSDVEDHVVNGLTERGDLAA